MGRQKEEFQMDQECSLHIFRPYLQRTCVIWILGPLENFRRTEGSSAVINTTMKAAVKSFGSSEPIYPTAQL
jgi:hypothetical protein